MLAWKTYRLYELPWETFRKMYVLTLVFMEDVTIWKTKLITDYFFFGK